MRLLEIINQNYISSSGVTEQYRVAKRQFRGGLKKLFKGDTVIMGSCPHFEFSGFIKRGSRFIYFSTGDLRHKITNSMLIRTAQSDADYTGGSNNFISYDYEENSNFDRDVKNKVNYLFTIL